LPESLIAQVVPAGTAWAGPRRCAKVTAGARKEPVMDGKGGVTAGGDRDPLHGLLLFAFDGDLDRQDAVGVLGGYPSVHRTLVLI
jgi:hypothetical protein